MTIEKTDLALAKEAIRDERAFETLVEKYSALVYTVAYRCAKNPTDAADIAQEAFLKAWRSLPAFRGDCSLGTWLCRIAQSCACDFARVKKRHLTVPMEATDENGEEISADLPETNVSALPEEELLRQADIEAVREAIDSLPEDARRIVTMRDLCDMTYAEIAEALGVEIGTVKSRLFRARGAVKDFLIKRNFSPNAPSTIVNE